MFRLFSEYNITAAQKQAADQVVDRFRHKRQRQVLLGVTGSGKTFTIANVIKELNQPVLILSPNKTLAAQLYQEFKGFFPDNRVGYFISYYDYYQPEAYVPSRNQYIAKEVSINPELERLRIDASRNILETGFSITVASVSAIYNIGSPDEFFDQRKTFTCNSESNRDSVIRNFVDLGYNRSEGFIESGYFRVRGDILEIFPTSEESPLRLIFSGNRVAGIEVFDQITGLPQKVLDTVSIYPISYFHFKRARIETAIRKIQDDLKKRLDYFTGNGQVEFATRLKEKTEYDLEMLDQYGYCPGIENYSLYLANRNPGDPPFTLIDFFGKNYLLVIDESHMTIPQLSAMYKGDRSRKQKLVDFGFRLPTALDNRPLNFTEITSRQDNVLYVSATPAQYELNDAGVNISELLVRPTGLLDPRIEKRKSPSPVEDMLRDIRQEIAAGNRVLVTTLTKKMSEKLADYLTMQGISCTYLHSEIKALDRIKVIRKMRAGEIDVLVGINLLREGLDLPEVSLVIIMDADREGYLRSQTALIQTFGRAARNINGRVIVYYQDWTGSLSQAVLESERRRQYQMEYNQKNNIVPTSIQKGVKDFYDDDYWLKKSSHEFKDNFKDKKDLVKEIDKLTVSMKKKADILDFKTAALLRERIKELKNLLIEMY